MNAPPGFRTHFDLSTDQIGFYHSGRLSFCSRNLYILGIKEMEFQVLTVNKTHLDVTSDGQRHNDTLSVMSQEFLLLHFAEVYNDCRHKRAF